jgi:hypothetical protein
MDAKIWSTSLLRGPLLYAENFLKSGAPDPRVLSRSDCISKIQESVISIDKLCIELLGNKKFHEIKASFIVQEYSKRFSTVQNTVDNHITQNRSTKNEKQTEFKAS